MKTFIHQAAQGDMLIRSVAEIPASAKPARDESGKYVVAHSETGHNHVIEKRPGVEMFEDQADALKAYLQVIADDVKLEHMRSFDTHETIHIPPGKYEIRRQREYMPEGWRRAAD